MVIDGVGDPHDEAADQFRIDDKGWADARADGLLDRGHDLALLGRVERHGRREGGLTEAIQFVGLAAGGRHDVPEDAEPGEWGVRELLAAAEVSDLLGVNPNRIAVQLCTQPVFSGMTAALHIRGVESAEAAEAALRDAPGLATAVRLRTLRPRKVMGRGVVYWGGVRPDPAGEGVHVWVAADNAAGAGAAVPVALAEALFGAGLAAEGEA